MANVEVYTWSACPFCRQTKKLLEKKGACDSLILGAYRNYEGMNIQVITGRKPYVT